jgi:hypothetical protein
MVFTLTLAWWWIPAAVTLAGIVWALFLVDHGDGIGAGLNNLLALVPVSIISAIAWAVAAFLK